MKSRLNSTMWSQTKVIWIDEPKLYQVPGLMYGRPFKSSHMFSDLPGKAGTLELITFGRKLGLKAEWLQKKGTWLEHFDVMNTRYTSALKAGAKKAILEDIVRISYARKQNEPTKDKTK